MARVLVIDDVEIVRTVIGRMLRKGGHHVIEVSDANNARQIIKKKEATIVVTDLWMPGEDGISLIKSLRSQNPTLPIIAVTGGAPRSELEFSIDEAGRAGADRVLTKPVAKDELLEAVAAVAGS